MTHPYIDPELRPILAASPSRPALSMQTLKIYRQSVAEATAQAAFPAANEPRLHQIDGPGGKLDIFEFAPSHFVPSDSDTTAPALLWLHGGGYVAGLGKDLWFGALFAEHARVRVFSVDYRLAPEHPFPAARDDAFAALCWLHKESAALKVQPDKIAIGGASAGGGLAAAVTLFNRDQAGPALAFQLLLYPMLDHLHDTPSGHAEVPAWPRETSLTAWSMYLDGAQATPASVPATEKNLGNLPPAFLTIGESDLFLDETRDYAARLGAAGVAASLKTYPGVYHVAERHGYHTRIGRQMTDDYVAALVAAMQ